MLAAYAPAPNFADPLSALTLGELPEPESRPGWVRVAMRAASLNMHDINTLRGVRMRPESYPMVLGCDGAGVLDDGTEVVVHPCVNEHGWVGPETLDPSRSVLSERLPGTFSMTVSVPARNVVPKPASVSFEEAACTGTAYLTAYRMVFVHSGLRPGQRAVALGRRGSIAAAVVDLATAAGIEIVDDLTTCPNGSVDAVFDAGVDEAAWSHALRVLRPGGTVVCAGYRSGATETGYSMDALHQLIFSERRLVGCTMGTREDLVSLLAFLDRTGLRPTIGMTVDLAESPRGFAAMLGHTVRGKVVFTMPG